MIRAMSAYVEPRVKPRVVDWISVFGLIAYMSLTFARELQGAPIAFLILALLVPMLRWKPNFDIFSISIIILGVIYVVLSYFDVPVRSWSPVREESYIIRQAHYAVLFPFYVIAMRVFLFRASKLQVNLVLPMVMLLILVWPLVILRSSNFYAGFQVAPYGFDNFAMIFYIAVILLFFRNRIMFICACATLAIFSDASQNVLVCAILIICRLAVSGRFVFIGAAMIPFVSVLMIPFFLPLYAIDANTGVRIMFASDALTAIKDSLGLGVGFGTWGVSNFYSYTGGGFVKFTNAAQNIYTISVHNSLLGLSMRLGLGILILYLAFVVVIFRRMRVLDSIECKFVACLAVMLFMAIATNVAIESPTYSAGVALVFAIIDLYTSKLGFRVFVNRGLGLKYSRSQTLTLARPTNPSREGRVGI